MLRETLDTPSLSPADRFRAGLIDEEGYQREIDTLPIRKAIRTRPLHKRVISPEEALRLNGTINPEELAGIIGRRPAEPGFEDLMEEVGIDSFSIHHSGPKSRYANDPVYAPIHADPKMGLA